MGDQYTGTFKSRKQARTALEQLITDYHNLSNKELFIQEKLDACYTYLLALDGHNIPFYTYIRKTMGIQPQIIPESALVEQLKRTKTAYKELGYSYDKNDLEKFKKEHTLNQKQIKESFEKYKNAYVPKILQWLDIHIDVTYNIQFVDKDEYWMNWISTDNNGDIFLQYNINKRHTWVRGSAEYLVFHEICAHALHMLCIKKQIQNKKLHPFIGLTTVFTPEQFVIEGIAEAMCLFYNKQILSTFGLANTYSDHMYWLAWNNGHIMANEGKSPESIVKFIQKYLPDKTEQEITKNIHEKTNDPLHRTYQYIYGIGLYYHSTLAKQLHEDAKKSYVLDIFHTIYSPDQIIRKYKINPQ